MKVGSNKLVFTLSFAGSIDGNAGRSMVPRINDEWISDIASICLILDESIRNNNRTRVSLTRLKA